MTNSCSKNTNRCYSTQRYNAASQNNSRHGLTPACQPKYAKILWLICILVFVKRNYLFDVSGHCCYYYCKDINLGSSFGGLACTYH